MSRKRRTLPTSAVSGDEPEFALEVEHWARIEAPYATEEPFPEDTRKLVAAIVSDYLFAEEWERKRPTVAKALEWLNAVRQTANELLRLVRQGSGNLQQESEALAAGGESADTPIENEAAAYALFLVEESIGRERLTNDGSSREGVDDAPDDDVAATGIERMLAGRVRVSEFLKEHLPELLEGVALAQTAVTPGASGDDRGGSWQTMISKLKTALRSSGLAVGTNNETGISPFVQFVHQLQQAMPAEAQQHMASMVALSKAISSIRPAGKHSLKIEQ